MKRQIYLDLMEEVVSAYSDEQIENYIAQVRERGIWEHGFPRLGANIGILMAHGKLLRLKDYFIQIMELCCEQIPNPPEPWKHRGNDFSVKEIMFCLLELENSDVIPQERVAAWKQAMAGVVPQKCYRMVASVPPEPIDNWAAFNAASEQLRVYCGIAHTEDYIENQVASQILSFEENGMYRDPNEPMVYDLVTRGQLETCLFFGYRGKDWEQLDALLERAGLFTLKMQSVTGELPFGGRSNQFLHNEAHIALICEYEARRYYARGDLKTAGEFKSAAAFAVENIQKWWRENPHHHIKNYYPIYSKMGCENYAYYDKYMVTAASFLYSAYLFADDDIPEGICPAKSDDSYTWQTSEWFHKLFCKQGEYFLELEMQADEHYDASGIGRIQKRGAPGPLCIAASVSQSPKYQTGDPNACPMSICPGVFAEGHWLFAWDANSKYRVLSCENLGNCVRAVWEVAMENGQALTQTCVMEPDGITLTTVGADRLGVMLPGFAFDGREQTRIHMTQSALQVSYHGWCCTYETDGILTDTHQFCGNRNGKYQIFRAEGDAMVTVKISIEKEL